MTLEVRAVVGRRRHGHCSRFSLAGFGFAMVLLSFLIAVYGSVVVAWSMLYLFSSMNKEVPWQRCKPEWHIENCTEVYSGELNVFCRFVRNTGGIFFAINHIPSAL